MRPVVFLGPSLPVREAERILLADYRPPVKRGDLGDLLQGTRIVGLIDGVFMSDAAVGHREIMSLLESGVTVVGGGSMGALRAAELSGHGMIGVGRVFEMYSEGAIDGDDEVALVFNPDTLEPLSEPLVNLRHNIAAAVGKGVISADHASALIDRLRQTYFPHRSYALLFEIAKEVLDLKTAQRLRDFIKREAEDLKRSDALMVIATIKTFIKKQKY